MDIKLKLSPGKTVTAEDRKIVRAHIEAALGQKVSNITITKTIDK